ncbi:potassium channel family protein [Lactobacillus kefiranofaciens]|uniref:Trk system potassium uptake protein TrkA n=2 Tax=Lactobacillus kefiranofaciens TaxID=267818 RepID=A0AAX3UF28_9LACO|nr:TrkA family potassium uptake protein [Lactobacillus kefiranofaciens]AEG40369.1 Trk family potassium (K+) transporter, NAD+ binding protein [Lactobacillus kefiranofaciens subsp. kefiranofaciens]QFQ67911.1 TrkA family potassium uptake protein [Lactobacillus kefiranofaciens subsp. kefiranofaciens]WGO86316.1 TrkA family potassium uptake protein [Lactobacillus kefiranofaciens]WQH36364.1 TrkA family potassium uptake protein [Lactobacillus kefiranofaciens]SDA61873.1 trk system potassium uptake pro
MANSHQQQSFAVLGIGKFGLALTMALLKANQDVLVVDSNEEVINDVAHLVTHAVIADATDEDELRDLDIGAFDHVFVTMGENVEGSIITTMLAKKIGAPDVTTRANNHNHRLVLEKIGADHVIEPEQDMARQLIFHQLHPNIVNYFNLSKDVSLGEVKVENPNFFNKSLGELDFRKNYNVNVIGIIHDGKLNQVPLATDIINPHDHITLIGSNEDVQKINETLQENK